MRKLAVLMVILGVFAAFTSGQARAVTIGLDPDSQDVVLGDGFSVDIVVSGFNTEDFTGVGGFDLTLEFDPSIIEFYKAGSGELLGDTLTSYHVTSDGSFYLAMVSLMSIQGDSGVLLEAQSPFAETGFVLAQLDFHAVGVGTRSPLTLTYFDLTDVYGAPYVTNLSGGSVNVAPVPEPSTMVLLCSGLAGLTALRRRFGSQPLSRS